MTSETTARVAPALSRRHAAGAASARGLLFTVLGEFVLPADRPAWTGTFLDLYARLGVEEKAVRQALMRTASDGWLRAERVGRRTRWHLTTDAIALLTDGTRRIFSFSGNQAEWDGRWLMAHVRVPETERATRHQLRTRLAWAGLGSLGATIWVSTHLDRQAEVRRILAETGTLDDALVLTGDLQAGQAPAALAAQAWDLAQLASRYEQFQQTFGARRATGDPLVRCTELVHAWRRFPWTDPELPGELLPSRWPAPRAVQTFAQRHADWADTARAEWLRVDAS